jgi:rare lipoprotein A
MRFIFIFFVLVSLNAFTQTGYVQEGKASFYADRFEGRVTASGERYTHQKATCAHLSLPFGSLVRVTNIANGSSIVVRVNDRGPFVANRIIDLSQSAAEKLGFLGQGLADVRVELLDEKGEVLLPQAPIVQAPSATQNQQSMSEASTKDLEPKTSSQKPQSSLVIPRNEKPSLTPAATPSSAPQVNPNASPLTENELYEMKINRTPPNGFTIQIGSYRELVNLLRIADDLRVSLKKEVMVQVATTASGDKIYRLMVGHFSARREAENFREKASKLYPDCFIVELK